MADLYEPWEKLIRIVVLGRVLEVPENNLLLRQLQYVSEDIGMGRYCWNGECRYCEIQYRRAGDPAEYPGLACRVRGFAGMRLTQLAREMRYNLRDVLAATPPRKRVRRRRPQGRGPGRGPAGTRSRG